MSNFFKIVFGSCLGTLFALGALILIVTSVIKSAAGSVETKPTVAANSILKIDLTTLPELTGNVDQSGSFTGFDFDEAVGVHDVIRTIERAKTDSDVKGIYLNSMSQVGGFTKLRMIRAALEDFKTSGKFIVSYAPNYSQNGYYLATAADEVYLGPLGIVDFRGLGAQLAFYKELMDRAGVQMEIFYAGKFKSATEPFRRRDMSPENKQQTREFLTDLWLFMQQDVAISRGISETEVARLVNNLGGWRGEEAVTYKLVDGIRRTAEVDSRLHELTGIDADDELNFVSLNDYWEARMDKLRGGGDEIAVLIAEGGIVDGETTNGSIGDTKYVEQLQKLMYDDDVKAVVLRVNSGGGSASSSENIWYAAEQLKASGKPFVVSMGSVAASGGYYIAAGADSIFAEPSTITGSIGVFSMFPNLNELMEEKIGITFDTVNVNKHANSFNTFHDLGEEERSVLTQRTEAIYETFLQRVAEGRNMPVERVREIAQGRVYSGVKARELGLVDRLTGLDGAINAAASLANLDREDVSVGHYPKLKSPLEELLSEIFGDDFSKGMGEAVVREQLGDEAYEQFDLIRTMTQAKGPQAVMPLTLTF